MAKDWGGMTRGRKDGESAGRFATGTGRAKVRRMRMRMILNVDGAIWPYQKERPVSSDWGGTPRDAGHARGATFPCTLPVVCYA